MNERIEKLNKEREHFAWTVEHYTKKLKEFADRFEGSPASAFEWAGNAYGHAANLECAEQIVELIDRAIASEKHTTIEDVARRVLKAALRKASSGSRSTSASCNLINEERVEAWANAAQRLNGINSY